MRTIRDNYYIITGHTYEEYTKKYHRGIAKGRLLSFTEEETKYLKKNKHYWEVIGPDGKTLYCQINKLKPKHIIIPLSIVGVIGLGVGAGILIPKLIGYDGKVTDEEWKQSFSYITDIGFGASNSNRASDLNYKATGSIYIGYNHESLYEGDTDLIVVKNPSGEYESARLKVKDSEYQNCSFRRYNNLPLVKIGNGSIESTTSLIHDTFDIAFESFYDYKDGFSYSSTNKNYVYSSEGTTTDDLFSNLFCEIKYGKDKKIQHLNLGYVLNKPDDNGICVSFDLEFTYGGQEITQWQGTESQTVYENHLINVTNDKITTVGGTTYAKVGGERAFNSNKSFLVNLDLKTATSMLRNEYVFKLFDINNENFVQNWTNFIEVYYNGQKVKRVTGSEDTESYYYDLDLTNKNINGIKLNFKPAAESTITLKFGIRIYQVEPTTGDYSIWIY